jgi:hypothetical protein
LEDWSYLLEHEQGLLHNASKSDVKYVHCLDDAYAANVTGDKPSPYYAMGREQTSIRCHEDAYDG